jgi:Rap1a immunity proteins
MVRSALFGAAALALTVPAAGADGYDTAAEIIPGCREAISMLHNAPTTSTEVAFEMGICWGTIVGISLMGSNLRWLSETKQPRSLCIDKPLKGATLEQMIRIVIAYVDARPARLHEKFSFLALEALRAAWPCK